MAPASLSEVSYSAKGKGKKKVAAMGAEGQSLTDRDPRMFSREETEMTSGFDGHSKSEGFLPGPSIP